ncbi:MAG: AmmeMemoRadiSam system protein A [Terriglobia bacterium]
MSPLSREAECYLLGLARRTLEATLRGNPLDLNALATSLPDPALAQPAAAFVTLHRQGRLRGCIGHLQPTKPLYRTVADVALAAAFHDPRFPPLEFAELADVEIEISLLSPSCEIRPEEVEVGRHGLIVSQGFSRGLLLPQVAVEQGWDRETFLEQTCRKAGLPPDAWKQGARLEAFTAEVFSEAPVKDSQPASLARPSFE